MKVAAVADILTFDTLKAEQQSADLGMSDFSCEGIPASYNSSKRGINPITLLQEIMFYL